MRGGVTLVLMAAFLISPARAITGNKLQEFCSGGEGSSKDAACTTYLAGFVAGLQAAENTKRKDARNWCFPEGSTVGQTILVVGKYMRDNPQSLHQDASTIVGKALLIAFPCKNSN